MIIRIINRTKRIENKTPNNISSNSILLTIFGNNFVVSVYFLCRMENILDKFQRYSLAEKAVSETDSISQVLALQMTKSIL
jgi:hypothetical protein